MIRNIVLLVGTVAALPAFATASAADICTPTPAICYPVPLDGYAVWHPFPDQGLGYCNVETEIVGIGSSARNAWAEAGTDGGKSVWRLYVNRGVPDVTTGTYLGQVVEHATCYDVPSATGPELNASVTLPYLEEMARRHPGRDLYLRQFSPPEFVAHVIPAMDRYQASPSGNDEEACGQETDTILTGLVPVKQTPVTGGRKIEHVVVGTYDTNDGAWHGLINRVTCTT